MHNSFVTNYTVLRITLELHAIGLRIELHNFFCTTKLCRRNVLRVVGKSHLFFALITLLMELFVHCSELKDRASVGKWSVA
jgi:hypothetical protein